MAAGALPWPHMKYAVILLGLTVGVSMTSGEEVVKFPMLPPEHLQRPKVDWLLASDAYPAGVFRTEHKNEIVLSNGLIRRTFRLAPNGATVGLENMMTGQSLLRGVKP